jgi:SAM-dependent methyltransferase
MLKFRKIFLHNWLVYKIHDEELLEAVSKYARGKLLDIGCGEKPYKEMVAPYVDQHIGIDHKNTLHTKSNIDRFGTAYDIPAEDNEFDSVLCTNVLEHLEKPEEALRECYRILKRKGIAIYTVPFIWHLHEEPRDFYRFSKYGIKYLFEKVDFEIVELKALSGFWVTFGQLFVYNIYRFNKNPLRWLGVIPLIGLAIQGFAYLLDKVDKAEQWTWAYIVVARKK